MSALFSRKLRTGFEDNTLAGKAVQAVKKMLADGQGVQSRDQLGSFISNESLGDNEVVAFKTAIDNYHATMSRMGPSLGLEEFTPSQIDSGTGAAVMSANINFMRAQRPFVNGQSNASTTFVGLEGLSDGFSERIPAFESYDERDNTNVVQNTVAYNMLAGRQNKFGEMFFPTVTCSPDNVGQSVTIHLTQVIDDFKREVTGAVAKYNRKNVIRAMIDATIMKNEGTRAIPVYRAQAAAAFVDQGVIAAAAINLEGESINTGPLAIGAQVDLLGLSQTDTLLAAGAMDVTDSLDPDVRLENIYLSVTIGADTDIIRLPVSVFQHNNFIGIAQDNYRVQKLAFDPTTLVIDKNTKKLGGGNLVALAGLTTSNLQLQVGVNMSGSVNIETGDLQVFAPAVKLHAVVDTTNGNSLSYATNPAKPIADAFLLATTKIIGYDLKAYRTNVNRRQRGQLLTTTQYTQQWAVPLRSPITSLKPVTADSQSDTADLASLVAGTFARTSNEAVSTLLLTLGLLRDFTATYKLLPNHPVPEILGVARMLIEPTVINEPLDVAAVINSVTSHEKAADIQAVMAQKIRDVVYRLYRDSGFQAVVESQAAGVSGEPTVLIGTDPMTARYLMVDGDNRLAGPDFKFQVQTTPDTRMQGKIVIALGYPEQATNVLFPLHFGAMLWVPELTAVLPISRNNQISRELTVQPRFRHIVNVPVMGLIEVSGISGVISTKTSIDFNEVP